MLTQPAGTGIDWSNPVIHHSERMMHMPSKSALLCLVAKRDHVSQTVCRLYEPWPANRGGALCIGSTATPILHTRHPISLLTGVTPGLISTPTPVHALHNTDIIEDLRMCQWWTRSPQAVGFPLTPDSRHNQRSSPSAKGSTCGYYKAGYNSSLRLRCPVSIATVPLQCVSGAPNSSPPPFPRPLGHNRPVWERAHGFLEVPAANAGGHGALRCSASNIKYRS